MVLTGLSLSMWHSAEWSGVCPFPRRIVCPIPVLKILIAINVQVQWILHHKFKVMVIDFVAAAADIVPFRGQICTIDETPSPRVYSHYHNVFAWNGFQCILCSSSSCGRSGRLSNSPREYVSHPTAIGIGATHHHQPPQQSQLIYSPFINAPHL